MTSPTTYASFLVRLWRDRNLERCPELAKGQPELTVDCYSEIEHIQSGQRWSFASLDEMLDFLRRQAGDLELSRRKPDEQPRANHERGGI